MGKKLAAAATITGTGAAATTAATLATQGSESEELARINASSTTLLSGEGDGLPLPQSEDSLDDLKKQTKQFLKSQLEKSNFSVTIDSFEGGQGFENYSVSEKLNAENALLGG